MIVLTAGVITLYVVDKILEHHIQNTWHKGVISILFPRETYRGLLGQVLTKGIQDFRNNYNSTIPENKIFFFEHEETFELLTSNILCSKNQSPEELIKTLKDNPQIITPTEKDIKDFYEFIYEKIKNHKKLRKLKINDHYKDEIFNISRELKDLSSKLNKIDTKLNQSLSNEENLKTGIESISKKLDQNIEIQNIIATAESYPQPLVKHLTKRVELVDKYLELLKSSKWLALTGSVSTGKTQAAALIAETYDNAYWINLRSSSKNDYFQNLVFQFVSIFNLKVNLPIDELFNEVINKIKEGGLIVLDDLPKLDDKDKFDQLIGSFISKCIKNNIPILTTSNFSFTKTLMELIGSEHKHEEKAPPFKVEEIVEILSSFGLQEEQIQKIVNLIHSISSGHPLIVLSICSFMQENGWDLSESTLRKLFNEDYSVDLNEQTTDIILKSILDDNSRHLLYRLIPIIGTFTQNEVNLVSSISPEIKNILEKFNQLIGLWVQKTKDAKFSLSPLLMKLGDKNLSEGLVRNINYSLAKNIIAKKDINSFEAYKAILYFIRSKSFNEAGHVLIVSLNEAIKTPELFFDYGLNHFWLNTEFPEKMDVFIRIYIRVIQIMLLIPREEDLTFLKNDLELLIKKTDGTGIDVGSGAMMLSTLFALEDSKKSMEYFVLGMRNLDTIEIPNNFNDALPTIFSPEIIIWSAALNVGSTEEVDEWFKTYEGLTKEQKKTTINSDFETRNLGAMSICFNIIRIENTKPEADRDWIKVIKLLKHIETSAIKSEIDIIAIHSIKYQVHIYSEKLKNIDEARRIYENCPKSLMESDLGKFLIEDCFGRQLFYNEMKEEALPLLKNVVDIEVDSFYTEKLDTYLVFSQLIGLSDPDLGLVYSEKAYAFAKESNFITEELFVKVIGEYAISLSLTNDINRAVKVLSEGYNIFLKSYEATDQFKVIAIRYGHILNYWFSILSIGVPPDLDSEGNPYGEPTRGMLLNNFGDTIVEQHFYEEKKFIVAFLFLQSFEYMADLDSSKKWAYRILKINSELEKNYFFAMMHFVLPYLIMDGKYDEAFSLQIEYIDFSNKLSEDKDASVGIKNEKLKSIIDERPESKIDDPDEIYYERIIIPSLINQLDKYTSNEVEKNEMILNLMDFLSKWSGNFKDQTGVSFLTKFLKTLMVEPFNYDNCYNLISTYDGPNKPSILSTCYLILSFFSNPNQAIGLQLAMIIRLESIGSQLSLGNHLFNVIPFFEKFWFSKIQSEKAEFNHLDFWESKSLKYYESKESNQKLKAIFKIICFHLNYTPSTDQEDWME